MSTNSVIGDGLLRGDELNELAEMLRSGESRESVDQQASCFLRARGAETAWELRYREAGTITFLLGNHRLFEFLTKGETYEVLLGQHLFTGRVDVVKVMHVATDNRVLRERQMKRLRLQSKINAPQFVAVHDVGYSRTVHFVVVEHVCGKDLRTRVREQGALPTMVLCDIASEIAAALEIIHSLGMVYGCLQPNKILLDEVNHATLCDAGIAELAGRVPFLAEATGKLVDFLSPEALAGGDVSPQSDIYSLGSVLYYAATSKVPFPGHSDEKKREGHTSHFPIDPRRLAEGLDDRLVDILAAMMAKSPETRIQSAREAAALFRACKPSLSS